MNEDVTKLALSDGLPEAPQNEAKTRGIVQRLFGGLAFKVGAAIILSEILVLTGIGIPLIASHNEDVDRRAVSRIMIPGKLLQERVLSYASVADRRIMTDLLGEELIGGMVVGGNGNVFYSLDPGNLGRDIGGLPGVDPAWFDLSNTERQLIETRGDGETFLISITPLFTLGSKVPSLFAYIKTNTTMLTENKAAWRRLVFLGAFAVVLTTSLIIFISFQMLIFRRIVRSADFVERVRQGDLDIRVATPSSDEFGTLERGMNEMVANLKRRQEQQTKAEEALRGSEARLSKAAAMAKIGYWVWDEIEDKAIYCSKELVKMYGVDSGAELTAMLSSHVADLEWAHPEDRERLDQAVRTAEETKDGFDIEYRIVNAVGETRHVHVIEEPVLDERGKIIRSIGTAQDITERKRTENALRESEARFRTLVEHAPEAITIINVDDVDTGIYVDANPMAEALHGRPREELIGKLGPVDLSSEIQLDGRPSTEAERDYLSRALAGEFPRFEWMHLDPNGQETLCEVSLARLPDPHRNLVRASITDITERKAAEEQLRQAQKMDAVGQLTAGVAHDFNNMLAVIWGNAELLEDELGVDNPLLAAVARATKRGADLTQRLLAFSRKQVLNPEIINANSLIADITGLLRRTLEEHIEVEAVTTTGLWNCEVDPGQLENALVNLAINARDAMPGGGKLTIETANAQLDDDYAAAQAEVRPGQYVMVAVTDTGSGMPPEVREHVFEPFFTTKEVGKGTGLGLSMVYGFIKQSGGHVTIYSEEGEGTTFKLYLPRSTKSEVTEKKPVTGEVPVARGETVLVVEDDPDLRTLAVALLSNLGYQVMEAATGPAALEELGSTTRVNLLLTDVVLPGGMNGRELADEVERRAPGIPVLYMSGYTADAIMHHGRLDSDAELLQKPFRRADLARAVRRVLDDPSA